MSHIAELAGKDSLSRRLFMEKTANLTLGVSTAAAMGSLVPGRVAQAAEGGGKAKSLIYIYVSGGMSHLDTFDPKTSSDVMGTISEGVSTKGDFQLGNRFEKLSQQADKISVINSMSSQNGAHEQGRYQMLTGYEQRATIVHPTIGPFAQELLGRRNEILPDSVLVNQSTSNAGYLDPSLSPLPIADPEGGVPNTFLLTDEERFERRMEIAQKLGQNFVSKYKYTAPKSYVEYYDQANKLLKSDALEAFDLSGESNRELYGMTRGGQGCLLARRLVEKGVRVVEVHIGGWDMHDTIDTSLNSKVPELDQALAGLIQDLSDRGMLDSTMVAVGTEFGRTPNINGNGGRDHYPIAFSTMLAGGGIKGGFKYGSTDKQGKKVSDENKKVRPTDFLATIGHGMGIPLETVIYSASRRPFAFANYNAENGGRPVLDLFA